AVQAARMGKRAVLIEPGRHVGGLTSGGLGATDIGNKQVIGGLSREFYERVAQHYGDDNAWRWQKRDTYRSARQASGDNAMWTFEPHVAEAILRRMLEEHGVDVYFEQPLLRPGGVDKVDGRIQSITMEDGKSFAGRMFVDATYEGDLLAEAGVSFHIGREANATYGETLNGVQVAQAKYHQFNHAVDPYMTPGDPASGLLPNIEGEPPGEDGAEDRRVQAYNFRMCLTDVKENQISWPKPEGYDPLQYELLARYFAAGLDIVPWHNTGMPNRKTDINNNGGFSTDYIGKNYDYPEASHAERKQIFAAHVQYQQGLMWFLAHDERVPANVQKEVNRWGLCRDEFEETGGWPHQMYVREARRMVSDLVMSQHHCQGRALAEDPIGMAAYTMDSHNTQRYVRDGVAKNEGDVQVGRFPPYPIGSLSIVPREGECKNLLVPVCLSATHIAYGSIRMEPVFMVLGQSAATAACIAIDADVSVQQVDRGRLRARLQADGQVLSHSG
ncbi:MAG: FAD-dependent oxidoreductase, partial [Planctomycetales bacterium]|nr:FAD-dependent oxidoreductase [Planctomycetales bacterium]